MSVGNFIGLRLIAMRPHYGRRDTSVTQTLRPLLVNNYQVILAEGNVAVNEELVPCLLDT